MTFHLSESAAKKDHEIFDLRERSSGLDRKCRTKSKSIYILINLNHALFGCVVCVIVGDSRHYSMLTMRKKLEHELRLSSKIDSSLEHVAFERAIEKEILGLLFH